MRFWSGWFTGKDAATVSEIIGLSVETWQQGSDTGEQLQLVADPRRLATLASLDNPSPENASELMQDLIWKISLAINAESGGTSLAEATKYR